MAKARKVVKKSAAKPARDVAPRATPAFVGFSSERLDRIRTVIEADIAAGKLPGAVVMIVRRGKLAYVEAFGWRDKAAGSRMTADVLFNIASMTKPMAALAALQLLEQGKLFIDDPVAKYFPKFGAMKVAVLDAKRETIVDQVAQQRPITIRDLTTHTNGIVYGSRGTTPVHRMLPDGSGVAAVQADGAAFLDKLTAALLLHQPGSTWDYGFGLDVLGQIIEQISSRTLGEYFTQHICGPLGMSDTSFLIPQAKASRYARTLPTDPLTGNPQSLQDLTKPTKFDAGGGGLASTASDYMRFALALLNRGAYGRARILGAKTADYMLTNHLGPDVVNLMAHADPTRAGYGFGLGLAVRASASAPPMLGSVGEFNWPGMSGTNWWADPQEQLAVVFMSHAPGVIRWHYRKLINALVYQAIVD